MKEAIELITKELNQKTFQKMSLSSPRSKSTIVKMIVLRAVKDITFLSAEYRHQKHNDIKTEKKEQFLQDKLLTLLESYKQIQIHTEEKEYQILINKNLKPKIMTKQKQTKTFQNIKVKNYILPHKTHCDFLIEIGIMGKNGKVKPDQYKKFKQINRFLEMVDDLYKDTNTSSLHIVDFGCGKSYLTFALYYYFNSIKKISVKITGIDLKQEVIDHCNKIAKKLNYDSLKFEHGLIHDFRTNDPIDFVVTLHACDTATDEAIAFSIQHNVDKMMFVPCCQHELNKQLKNDSNQVLLKFGIVKDRLTALITDTARAQLLELSGYKVQVMEFIDMEHTAKNILLRCQKTKRSLEQTKKIYEKYKTFKNEWNITPYLEKKLELDLEKE